MLIAFTSVLVAVLSPLLFCPWIHGSSLWHMAFVTGHHCPSPYHCRMIDLKCFFRSPKAMWSMTWWNPTRFCTRKGRSQTTVLSSSMCHSSVTARGPWTNTPRRSSCMDSTQSWCITHARWVVCSTCHFTTSQLITPSKTKFSNTWLHLDPQWEVEYCYMLYLWYLGVTSLSQLLSRLP